jgi:hypothetical protein
LDLSFNRIKEIKGLETLIKLAFHIFKTSTRTL